MRYPLLSSATDLHPLHGPPRSTILLGKEQLTRQEKEQASARALATFSNCPTGRLTDLRVILSYGQACGPESARCRTEEARNVSDSQENANLGRQKMIRCRSFSDNADKPPPSATVFGRPPACLEDQRSLASGGLSIVEWSLMAWIEFLLLRFRQVRQLGRSGSLCRVRL